MSGAEIITVAVVATGTGIACAHDVARRRIPNGVTAAIAGAGLGLAATGVTGVTLWSSLGGCLLGLALMLPGHVLGATGAGDVKLLGAAGAVLGAGQVVEAFAFTAIAGGILALGFAWRRGRLRRTVTQTARLCVAPNAARSEIEASTEHNRFPYAPAIAVGVVLAALR
jgi:prepilin peptidase CpaA